MTFPPDFTFPREKTACAHRAAHDIQVLAPNTRAVVQAGGCSGLWPLALSYRFDRVYTFEPSPDNFRYLQMNTADRPTVTAYQMALGDRGGSVGLSRPKATAGLWHIDGDGDIPLRTLDYVLGDTPVDAIVLDVEGYEVEALHGAERLIRQHAPLLWFEFARNQREIAETLEAHGYSPPKPIMGLDHYSVKA